MGLVHRNVWVDGWRRLRSAVGVAVDWVRWARWADSYFIECLCAPGARANPSSRPEGPCRLQSPARPTKRAALVAAEALGWAGDVCPTCDAAARSYAAAHERQERERRAVHGDL